MRTNNGAPRTQALERVAPIWRVPREPSRPIHRGRDEAAGDALLQHGEDPRLIARIGICPDSANGSNEPYAGMGGFSTGSPKVPRMLLGAPTPYLQHTNTPLVTA